MSNEEEIKFPLSKKVKAQFQKDYEAVFLNKPPHNISDEKLVELVQANAEKLKGNEGTQQPPQEGIQNGEINQGGNENDGNEAQKATNDESNGEQNLKGEEAIQNLGSEESKLTEEELQKDYFDLFGKKPLSDMTKLQTFSAIENERKRQEIANEGKTPEAISDAVEYDSKTEMLVENIKTGEKRVINIATFPFLTGWKKLTETPSEIKNKNFK